MKIFDLKYNTSIDEIGYFMFSIFNVLFWDMLEIPNFKSLNYPTKTWVQKNAIENCQERRRLHGISQSTITESGCICQSMEGNKKLLYCCNYSKLCTFFRNIFVNWSAMQHTWVFLVKNKCHEGMKPNSIIQVQHF